MVFVSFDLRLFHINSPFRKRGWTRSSLQYWDLSFKEKVFSLYEGYKEQIDSFCKVLKGFGIFAEITKEKIDKFIVFRNSITHTFSADFDEEIISIFIVLEAIVYFSIFERIGFKPEEVSKLLNLYLYKTRLCFNSKCL